MLVQNVMIYTYMFNFISVFRACGKIESLYTISAYMEKVAYKQYICILLVWDMRIGIHFSNTFDNSQQKCLSELEDARVMEKGLSDIERYFMLNARHIPYGFHEKKTFYNMFTFKMFIMPGLTSPESPLNTSYFLVYILIIHLFVCFPLQEFYSNWI